MSEADETFLSNPAFGVFVAVAVIALYALWLTIYGMYRAARTERWPWFWAILGTWLVGLGWLLAVIYLRTVDKPKSKMNLHCSKCDTVIAESAKFCPACGVAFDDGLCPRCGAKTSEGAAFCDECGTDLKAET